MCSSSIVRQNFVVMARYSVSHGYIYGIVQLILECIWQTRLAVYVNKSLFANRPSNCFWSLISVDALG